jgi:uncharacterized spore protein YtfJ
MEALDVLAKVYGGMGVQTAIGEPLRYDGLTIIPVVRMAGGGGGGGGGTGPAGSAEPGDGTAAPGGEGTGFGLRTTPIGVFVVRDGNVSWRPAVDVNKVILGAQIVAVVALLTIRSIARTLRRRQAEHDT